MDKNALYILDAFGLIFRSYYAYIRQPLQYNGKNTSAIFGFFHTLFSILYHHNPRYLVVACDSPGDTFRHKLYTDYKANRDASPEDLISQIEPILRILEELGLPILRKDGYEADDIIAALCKQHRAALPCYIISSDKDLLQLVGENVYQLKPQANADSQLMDREAVFEAWQVYPEQIADFLSIVGDSSDNIPGVAGIGKVGAAKLLSEYKTLEAVYDHLDDLKESQRKKLLASQEMAELSRKLVALADDIPLDLQELEDFKIDTILMASTAAEFHQYGIRSMLNEFSVKLKRVGYNIQEANNSDPSNPVSENAADRADAVDRADAADSTDADPTSLQELAKERSYDCVQNMSELETWLNQIRQEGLFSFDSETDSLDPMRAKPVGFSLSVAGKSCYIPLRGPQGAVFPEDELRDAFRELFQDSSLKLVCQNAKYDIKVLHNWGVGVKNLYFDTMIAAWMLNSDAHNYGMDTLAAQELNYTPISFSRVMKECKATSFEEVPLDIATFYAAEDADITLQLFHIYSKTLQDQGLDEIYFSLEMPLIDVLVSMEVEGIFLDRDVLHAQSEEISADIKQVQEDIFELCGHTFNINSPLQLQEVLFTERGLKPLRKVKSGYSTDNMVLQQLITQDPLPGLVLRYRMLNKLKSSYIDLLPQMIHPGTGMLHTNYIQTGAATGRLASKDPNLQNIPVKTKEGRRIRSAFYAVDDNMLVSADYSQIELIVLAHFSQDSALLTAFRDGLDVHDQTATLLFGSVDPDKRRIAKSINFGVIYGMSAFRLSNELSISRSDAQEFITTYFERYKQVRSFIDENISKAKEQGYVKTLLGRKRYVTAIQSKNHNLRSMGERIAINTIIQGSAADIIKRAMLSVAERLSQDAPQAHLVLQIHDELVVECPAAISEAVQSILIESMGGISMLSLPLQVHTTIGRSWGEL